MKKLLLCLLTLVFTSFSIQSLAQSFSIEKDTARGIFSTCIGGDLNIRDSIKPVTGKSVISWKVTAVTMPASWQPTISICDNHSCYTWSLLWPSTPHISDTYAVAGALTFPTPNDFHASIDLCGDTNRATGYLTVLLTNMATSHDTTMVYAFTNVPNAIPGVVKSEDNISLYPNPTTSSVNITYVPEDDIKLIAVYNMIGKEVATYRPISDRSANLGLENVGSGIYFIRLVNSKGSVVATRKFTKQ